MFGDSTADLEAVGVAAAVPLGLLLSGIAAESVLRPVLAAPLLTVIPGYAVLAAVSPASGPLSRAGSNGADSSGRSRQFDGGTADSRLTGIAWWIGTLVVGVLAVAVLARALLAAPVKYDAESLLVGVTVVVAVGLLVAALRRRHRSPGHRYDPRPRSWISGIGSVFGADDAGDAVLSIVLAGSLVLLLASAGFAATVDQQSEEYTELYLLNQNESETVAGNYPSEVGYGDRVELTVGVGNHEGNTETYTVVVELQRVQNGTVAERQTVTRMGVTVGPGETWQGPHSFELPFEGDGARVRYYLYRGDSPTDPDAESAYRTLEHWLTGSGS
ncbi:Uncharacterized membrane protein [Natronoarchaeum philippinense]|uniref:Uncharacterized membrane protein n=1 Tax=Natronoarchaeum philippinense TaxID=558529 RepID=A0A285P9U8_NATPI|nr:DUF1616 domain-containing protein [Natronoarchaeum philippinense]SNZ16906.1 Uncharacterized membrane protein [Natronoarchaeum philippinense]